MLPGMNSLGTEKRRPPDIIPTNVVTSGPGMQGKLVRYTLLNESKN